MVMTLPDPARACILVVDDEPGIQRALARLLQPLQVVPADSGAAAQRLVEEGAASFGAVICDVMMPGLSGIELHRWLSSRYPALAGRLAFVSGGILSEDTRRYLEQVPCPKILKPFDVAQVKQVVAALLASRTEAFGPSTEARR